MTCEMRSTSRPRAATSVATRMSSLPGFQPRDGAFALLLRNVAVQRRGAEAARLEPLGKLGGLELGAHEDQHGVEALRFEHPRQRIELVHAAHEPVALADLRRRAARGSEW